MAIHQAYRYALAPTPSQEERLIAFASAARFAYNWGLALVKLRLNLRRALGPSVEIPWSYKALCSEFARSKDEVAPWRGEVIVGSFQTGFHALGQALATYSRARRAGRRAGFPRFRAKGRSPERVFSQDCRVIDSCHIGFPKVGAIKTRRPQSFCACCGPIPMPGSCAGPFRAPRGGAGREFPGPALGQESPRAKAALGRRRRPKGWSVSQLSPPVSGSRILARVSPPSAACVGCNARRIANDVPTTPRTFFRMAGSGRDRSSGRDRTACIAPRPGSPGFTSGSRTCAANGPTS